jgi:capsid protein
MKLGNFHFGYNATVDKGRRQAPKSIVTSEEKALGKKGRDKLQATTQDQVRNHSLVAWMVRKHLDYVSKFHVSFRTERADLDNLVEQIFKWHGAPRNMDYLGRFGRDEMFRLFEMEKVVGGDAGLLKLPELKLQAIESDLICKGIGAPDNVNNSGLVVDAKGRVLSYAVCERDSNGGKPVHSHLESIDAMIFDGYWTRFASQSRGVSPLSTAINMVQDISESFEYSVIKAKTHALFGIAIERDPEGVGSMGASSGQNDIRDWTAEVWTWAVGEYCSYNNILYRCTTAHSTTTSSVFATDLAASKWAQDTTETATNLNPEKINILDMNPGEKATILESKTPSTEFVNGSYLFIQIALLALDIPITSFDSRKSSFSARIADLNEYEVSSDSKRTKNKYVRQEYSDWVLATIWNDPKSPWPLRKVAEKNGFSLLDVQQALEWIPSGSPWLDKLKQVMGDQVAVNMMLDNSIDAARRRGANVFDNIDKQAKVIAYAKQKGVPLSSIMTSGRSVDEVITASEEAVVTDVIKAEPEGTDDEN